MKSEFLWKRNSSHKLLLERIKIALKANHQFCRDVEIFKKWDLTRICRLFEVFLH